MIGIEQNRWSAKNSLGIIVITLNNLKEMKKFFRKKNKPPVIIPILVPQVSIVALLVPNTFSR